MTDLQARIDAIDARADTIKKKHCEHRVPSDADADVAVLAYLVHYLAVILRKHLETGEK